MNEITNTEAREAYRIDAIEWAQEISSADSIGRRAFAKVVEKYAKVGADIVAKGLTYGQAAWIANYTDESEAEYREECRANGGQARPMGQESFRRAWQIAKRMVDDGASLSDLVASYEETLVKPDGAKDCPTLSGFATWCGKCKPAGASAPKHPTEYLAEALRKCVNGGVDMADVLRMVDEAYSAS